MTVSERVVGSGAYTYEVLEDWARVPDGWEMPAAAVTVDSQDRVYCFNRTLDHPIVVFDRDGNYLSSWGAGLFAFPHAIRADERDNLWTVDREHGQALLYSPRLASYSRRSARAAHRSDTGVPPDDNGSTAYRNVTHGGGPFNLPTDIALTPSGEMFISRRLRQRPRPQVRRRWHPPVLLGRAGHRARTVQPAARHLDRPARAGCWWRTARTTACRSSTRRASSWRSGRPS